MYPIILLTQEEMKARWDKDLCYNCDEVYSFEHRCAKIQFYMLKVEEEGDEEEVENTEIVFDSGGKFREVPDPEPTPIGANSGSDLESPMLNLPELEGVRPESETRPLMKEIKPPDSEIATYLAKSQEATIEATSEAKNTKPWPKPDLNRNSELTLSYPNPIFPPTQTQSFHTVNGNTAAFLNANKPEPWPNKPSINTNPNRPNPWPNKLPTLTYFIRPKPWPGDYPICNAPKPRAGSNETKKFRKQTRRRSYQFQPRIRTKSDGQLSAFPVTNHARQRNQHRFWSTHSLADAIELLIAIHRTSWTIATTYTSSRPESQLMVLPVYDPGDFRSKEDEGGISFDFNGYLGYFGRVFESNQQRIEENSRRFSEKRRIGNPGNPRKGNENQRKPEKIWGLFFRDFGLVKKKKLGFMRRFGCLGLKEIDLGISGVSSEKRRERGKGWFYAIRYSPNGCVLGIRNPGSNDRLVCVLEYQIPWSKWSATLIGSALGLGQLGHLQFLSISIPWPIGSLFQTYILEDKDVFKGKGM